VRQRPDVTELAQRDVAGGRLNVLNLVYDVMPIDFVTLIVTEFGLIPPTSVPVILREKRDDEALYDRAAA
jgi:translation initiation factor 2B subunit (eIF-2B alpha/beta/delta family)